MYLFLLGFGCGVVFLLFSLFGFGVKDDCFYSAIVCLLLCEIGVDAFLLSCSKVHSIYLTHFVPLILVVGRLFVMFWLVSYRKLVRRSK